MLGPGRVRAVCGPGVGRVVVDAHGWWIDGPVARWLALPEEALGRTSQAVEHMNVAVEVARRINDVRSVRVLGALADRIDVVAPDVAATGDGDAASVLSDLDGRERQVPELLVDGLTNPQIAARLAYSVSTIRDATVSIYHKLGAWSCRCGEGRDRCGCGPASVSVRVTVSGGPGRDDVAAW